MFLLSRGGTFADALPEKLSVYKVLIGDPTLRLRYDVPRSGAQIEVSQTVFDLGQMNTETHERSLPFKIKNTGTQPLRVITEPHAPKFKPDDGFFFRSSLYLYTEIGAGEEQTFQMQFRVKTKTKGRYELKGPSIISNADDRPLIRTQVIFEVK